jgi:NADPH:quinone reductase-like Zn-dependent oxidoreductase
MPTNTAAWLGPKHARLEVAEAPYSSPDAHQVVVRNHAVAINPVDWILQVVGDVIYPWLKYPFVIGEDVAGEVVEVGSAVTRFKIGDRVLGLAVGTDRDTNTAAEGAFQHYTVLMERLVAPIPANMAYESAAVLPLGLATAACGLFQTDQLALQHPSANPILTGKTLLVWGGSTSVGSNAIQLAVAAGYEVIATASPQNFEYVTRLGASRVFDYSSPTVDDDIIAAFRGKSLAGALAIGTGSAKACADIVHACEGRKFIASTSTPASFAPLAEGRHYRRTLIGILLRISSGTVAFLVRCRVRGIRTKAIFATSVKLNEVSSVIFEDFLPRALADGRYIAAPEPTVIGHGLEHVQAGFDRQRTGVSATKVVITL